MNVEGRPKELSVTNGGSDVLTAGLKRRDGNGYRAIAFKVSHVLTTLFFVWLFLVHLVGLFLFAKGFLLSRLVLEDRSLCETLPDGLPSLDSSDGCWHPKTFKRAVVIVIDALRYDFTVPFHPTGDNLEPRHYHNNLPFLYETASNYPEKAFLLPFIADPPTSTLQRLGGLTAGNLPTFVDIGSNFAGQATEEDNILVQLRSQQKKIVHLGDDTWHALFPGYFDQNLTHAYDSFNVWDLHTVDNGVIEHIFPLLKDQKTLGWDIIFGHFLGVDHAGHRYGPDHPAMAEKLQQMNGIMSQLAQQLDDETLLVVMGDHGMDPKGDHGGESDDEVEAALWMYSNGPRFGRIGSDSVRPPATAKTRPVEQVDLVSTLSLLLGLPVPFNNLGHPIQEAFLRHAPATIQDQQNLAKVNRLVFEQMRKYQSRYAESREFYEDDHIANLQQPLLSSKNHDQKFNAAFRQWHTATIAMYRQLWANFDLPTMAVGVAVLLSGLAFLVLLAATASSGIERQVLTILRLIGTGAFAGVAVSLPGLVNNFGPSQAVSLTGPLSFGTIGSIIGAIVSRLRSPFVRLSYNLSIWTWLGLMFTVAQAAGFAANSFTIHEDTILTFFLSTFAAVSLVSSLRQGFEPDRILGIYHSALFAILTRVASYSRLCREEQMPGCRSTFYASQTSSTSATWQLLIPAVIAIILPELIKAFYKGTLSWQGSATFWVGFCFRTGLSLSALYWVADTADNAGWTVNYFSSDFIKTFSITIARCVFAVAIPVGVSTFIWAKPCIDISTKTDQGFKSRVIVLGFGNVFGTHYFLLVPIFMLSIVVLLPPMGQFSLAICMWQILSLLEILDTNGLTIGEHAQPYIGPVILAMLGSYHFFKTGHQAVLSSIQWNAAFVPLRTIRYPWSPILVVLNNFGPQIMCAVAVPLTVLWKRPMGKDSFRAYWSLILQACIAHVLYYATIQTATTMWAGHLRRHLMLYRVFMPRFLMASVVLLIVDLVLIVFALGGARITGSSVAEIFGY